jgi:methylthioxylose transferase
MRRIAWIVVGAETVLVAAFTVALRSGRMPLGVPGQWEWQRIKAAPSGLQLLMGLATVSAYSIFAWAGYRALSTKEDGRGVKAWLLGLVLASVAVQGVVQEAAPDGYGLSKWIFALHSPGSSGYYTVAKAQMGNARRFLADYPGWIEKQDALHVGTHPPGLFLLARMMLDTMEAHPVAARLICDFSPPSAASAIRVFQGSLSLPRADAAGLALTGALTLMACACTVVPIYALARSSLSAPASWASAAFWPLVPSALMFQPTADTSFPLLSTTALALTCWAGRAGSRQGLALCTASGLVMALGMIFTLAFLPVGLVVALVLLTTPETSRGRRIALILATGLGFLVGTLAWWAATSANPFAIWWVNQRNHARFYVEYPRSYLAWVVENPIELSVALGLPTMAWALIGLGSPKQAPRVALAAVFVLFVLTISGKNLSEVARLWLPLMPPLLVAAGAGFSRLGDSSWTLAGTIVLVGLQALVLEATIQVVYPF